MENAVAAIVWAVGDDVNNPHTTWDLTTFQIPETSRHEGLAGNPFHLALITLTVVMLISRGRLRRANTTVIYGVGLVCAFLGFCAVFRWQPWHTRLHLPLFVLWAAPIGAVLGHTWPAAVTHGVSLLVLVLALPFAVSNQLRPLIGDTFDILSQDRSTLYFVERGDLLASYRAATAFIQQQNCPHVGLDSSLDTFEYPILALLGADRKVRSVKHVGVQNLSARYAAAAGGTKPCAVICLNCATAMEKWQAFTGSAGPGTIFGQIVVFQTTAGAPAAGDETRPLPHCTLAFVAGWHAQEHAGRFWWRWTEGYGELRVTTTRDSDVVMVGLVSTPQPANAVDLFLNDSKVATWEMTGGRTVFPAFLGLQPFTLPLHLAAGQTRLVLASHKPATRLPPDDRLLAFAVWNLLIVSADGTVVCELQP
jgi:hypothetical protein